MAIPPNTLHLPNALVEQDTMALQNTVETWYDTQGNGYVVQQLVQRPPNLQHQIQEIMPTVLEGFTLKEKEIPAQAIIPKPTVVVT